MLADQFVLAIAEHAAPASIDVGHAAVGVGDEDAGDGLVQDRAQAALAVFEPVDRVRALDPVRGLAREQVEQQQVAFARHAVGMMRGQHTEHAPVACEQRRSLDRADAARDQRAARVGVEEGRQRDVVHHQPARGVRAFLGECGGCVRVMEVGEAVFEAAAGDQLEGAVFAQHPQFAALRAGDDHRGGDDIFQQLFFVFIVAHQARAQALQATQVVDFGLVQLQCGAQCVRPVRQRPERGGGPIEGMHTPQPVAFSGTSLGVWSMRVHLFDGEARFLVTKTLLLRNGRRRGGRPPDELQAGVGERGDHQRREEIARAICNECANQLRRRHAMPEQRDEYGFGDP